MAQQLTPPGVLYDPVKGVIDGRSKLLSTWYNSANMPYTEHMPTGGVIGFCVLLASPLHSL